MENGALDHPLEPGGWGRLALLLGFERLVFLIEVLPHHIAQIAKIHPAGLHHLRCILIVDQRQQEVLQRSIFVGPLRRVAQRGVQRLFEALGETGHLSYFRWQE